MSEIITYPVTETIKFTSTAYLEKTCPKGRFCWKKDKDKKTIMECEMYQSNGSKEYCRDE